MEIILNLNLKKIRAGNEYYHFLPLAFHNPAAFTAYLFNFLLLNRTTHNPNAQIILPTM